MNAWELEPNNTEFKNKVAFSLNQYVQAYRQSSCVGASGAVMGVVAALVLLRPNAQYNFLLPLPIWVFGLGYFIFELKAGFYDKQADQIAHLAHAGGMVAGFIIMFIWKQFKLIK
jgi:membrane associated rhomboid family serine protease